MNCNKCGKQVNDDMIFCPYCGEKIYHNVIDIIEEEKVDPSVEKGPWKNFAITGSVLGKISLCLFWFIGVGVYLGVFGIVFSCLGRKSKVRHEMANVGFKRSLVATILALAFISFAHLVKFIIERFF